MNNDMTQPIWATAVSRNASNDRVIVFRYIKDFGKTFDRKNYPVRIIIAWKYDSETGMPATDVREWMDATEDALNLFVEKDGFASLPLVSTGENLREWKYYVGSEDEFMIRVNQALADRPEVPIDIQISEDPQWTMYDEFKRNVRE